MRLNHKLGSSAEPDGSNVHEGLNQIPHFLEEFGIFEAESVVNQHSSESSD
jgi:hypothetical protein